MTQPAPALTPAAAPPGIREVRAVLHELGLGVSHRPAAFLEYELCPGFGSPFAKHRVQFGSLEEARQIVTEFPAHLNAAPPWTAALHHQAQDPTPHIAAWTFGYMAARKQFFPVTGRFVPLGECNPIHVPCSYDTTEEISAFYAGVRSYMQAVRRLIQRPATPAALQLHPEPAPTAKEALL